MLHCFVWLLKWLNTDDANRDATMKHLLCIQYWSQTGAKKIFGECTESSLMLFLWQTHISICTVLVDLKLSSATSSLYKERGTGTIWACSQNPLKHNTQHMALRHAEQLNKYLTPIPAYTDRHPHEMISQLRVLILCCNFLKTCLTCS